MATIWDAGTGRELLSLELPNAVTAVAFSPDGARAGATGDSNGIARVLALRVDDLVRYRPGTHERHTDLHRTVRSASGPLLGPAGGLPGRDRRGGPAAARVPGIRRRESDRGLHARTRPMGASGSRSATRTEARGRRPGRTRSPATGSRSPSGPTPGAPGTGTRPSGVRTAPFFGCPTCRSVILQRCDPNIVKPWARAVFGSHPWTIVGGAMGG